MGDISRIIQENLDRVQERIADCADIHLRPMKLGRKKETDCFLIYIEGAVENLMLEDSIIGKLLNRLWDLEEAELYQVIEKNSLGVSDTKMLSTMEEAFASMLSGNVVLFVERFDRAVEIGGKGYPGNGVQKAESEKVLRGSREAFSESQKTNTALIRKRIRDTRLKVKDVTIGRYSGTKTAILYLEGVVYPPTVQELEARLSEFSIDGVLDGGVLEYLTENRKVSPFPQYEVTERPDRAAMALLEGRAVVVCDNSPEVLLLPAVLNSMFQTSDDYYRHFAIVSFLRVIRYLGAFLAASLPALYLAAVNFHTRILPTALVFSLAKAREGVPFPSLVEILLLELSFELLREAGLRMPGPAGDTIGIVGGLIVGQAAVSANIVSPVVVVVVALTALGSFAVPKEELSEALRLLKYMLLIFSAVFGILGIVFGWLLVLIHLAGLKSYGIAYLMPCAGWEGDQGGKTFDHILRGPMKKLTRRPIFARRENRKRMAWKEKGGPSHDL